MKNHILQFLLLFFLIIGWHGPAISEDKIWDPYPKHVHICLEALNYHMGDEKGYAELLGVQDVGETDCCIYAIFKNDEMITKFNEARITKGLDPDFISYNGDKIRIRKTIGEVVKH